MTTNPNNPNCPNCNKSGLAILPVRYAVAPLDVNATLPGPLGKKVRDVKISHHKYVLRTLRQGFLYLFYEKHARGSHIKWEVYSVSAAGTVWKQYSTQALQSVTDDPACSRTGHNIPASVIAIEKPEKCGKVWMAFSEHAWSGDAFKMFEQSAKLREERMQSFLPASWIGNKKHEHGMEGTQANVEQVIEYQDNFNPTSLTGGAITAISASDGSYKSQLLKKQTTRYPLYMRMGQSKRVTEAMKEVGRVTAEKHHPAVVFALWDAVGIAHELNGFRNDAAGWIDRYGQERELELTTMNAIEAVRKIFEGRVVEEETQRQKDTLTYMPRIGSTQERRIRAAKLQEPERSHEIEVCNILDDWAKRQLPSTLGYTIRLNETNLLTEPRRSTEVAKIKADAEAFLARRASNTPEHFAKVSWSQYEAKLDKDSYSKFKKNYDTFLEEADKLIDERTDDLLAWLESEALVNAFVEFHQGNIDDGVMFDDQVGTAIHGINSTSKGIAKIDAWVKEMKATKTNLLWRAIALNQEVGIVEFNDAMAAATEKAPVGKLTLDFLAKHVRKMADIYKKANTMQNTLLKAANVNEGIKKVKVTDFDRLFMTVGDRLFKPFLQRGVDTSAEFALRGVMLARAGVEPDRILDALQAQAKAEGLARADLVLRLKEDKYLIGSGKEFKDAKYAELQEKWKNLKADPAKGSTALKENRLSLIVATLEVINLTKIAWEFKENKRTYGELAAATCSAIAAVSDIAANAAKHLVGDKVSVTFQKLKVFGGLLSAGAGYYAAMKEWEGAEKADDKGYYGIAFIYKAKAFSQFLSATFGLLSSLSYAAPLLSTSSNQAMKWVGGRLLFYRLFCMTWAVRINMVGLAVTLLIWVLTPNPLKEWLEESPFGNKKDKGVKDPQVLMVNLSTAFQEIS